MMGWSAKFCSYIFLPNSSLLAELLQSCIKIKSFNDCKKIHARILKTQFSSETFIQNRLIDAYSKCGCLRYAHKVFDKMVHKNTFSWNAIISVLMNAGLPDAANGMFHAMPEPDQCSWNSMISGFAQHGWFLEAIEFFACMHGEDFILSVHSFSSVLSACAGLIDCGFGAQVHALIFKSLLVDDVYMGSALVDMYSKCKRPLDACRVFEEMRQRNVVSWNSIITCYEQNGPAIEALELFVEMLDQGVQPDEVTLASLVSACATLAALREGAQIHAYAMKIDNFRDDMILSNALVDMYAKCKKVEHARSIFDRMSARSIVSDSSLISGYAKSANVADARLVFLKMKEKNIVAWNALIAGYTQNGKDEEALRMFCQLKREHVVPTHYTFGNVLNACSNLSNIRLGQQAHAHVLKHGFRFEAGPEADIFLGNAVVDMYLKCGYIEDGGKAFDRMAERDTVSWNAMIVGYAQNGHSEQALNLFKIMVVSGKAPDNVTMIGVLSACSHAGLVDEGRHYFHSMSKNFGLVPARDHYTCIVDLLGRAGHLREVEEFIEKMPVAPDSVLWGSLLAACRLHGNVEMGEWVAEKLFELDPGNSGPYILLSNMYAEMQRWKDVLRIRKMMKHKGVVKQPGCSWIEIEKKVHVFLVKDKRHPCRNEIFILLKNLKAEMNKVDLDIALGFPLESLQIHACGY